jgi:O-antigen/teichoic acid export membrane protein
VILQLRKHPFVRNVATLQVGSFAGSVIQAGIGVIIARLLQPELFGIYSLAFGMAGITSLIIGMGIQEAVSSMLGRAYARQDQEEIGNLLGFMLKLTFYAALVVLLISFLLPLISKWLYDNYEIGFYGGIVAVAVIFSSSLFTLAYSVFQATRRVKSLSVLILSDQSLRYGLSLFFIFLGWGVLGAALGQLTGALIIFVLSAFWVAKVSSSDPLIPGLKRILSAAHEADIRKYFNFTFWVALDRNMGNVYMALPVILTGIYVAASEVSFFKLAFGYINIALGLLGPISILLNVEFPKMEVANREKLHLNFRKVSFYAMGLSFLITLGAIIASPVVFKFLYGESFMPSVKYIEGLIVYGAFMGIGVGLGPMWRAINKVKVSIFINSLILAAGIPSGLWLIKNYSLWGAVIMVTAWFVVSHLVSFIYLMKKLGQEK